MERIRGCGLQAVFNHIKNSTRMQKAAYGCGFLKILQKCFGDGDRVFCGEWAKFRKLHAVAAVRD